MTLVFLSTRMLIFLSSPLRSAADLHQLFAAASAERARRGRQSRDRRRRPRHACGHELPRLGKLFRAWRRKFGCYGWLASHCGVTSSIVALAASRGALVQVLEQWVGV